MFVFVLLLIEETRKPKYYQWLFRSAEPGRDAAPQDALDIDIQPYQPLPPGSEEGEEGEEEQGGGVPVEPRPADERGKGSEREAAAWTDGWRRVLRAQPETALETLQRVLRSARRDQALEAGLEANWLAVLPSILSAWDAYLQDAHSRLAEQDLPAGVGQAWTRTLESVERQWRDAGEPALRELSEFGPRRPWPTGTAWWRGLEAALDGLYLSRVKDNTVFSHVERPAWFRCLERVRDFAERTKSSPLDVSYLQLAQQPAQYRGRLVRIRGEVREARRVPAPANETGVKAYYVLWLKPDSGNSPLAVYSLTWPADFPAVADKSRGEPPTRLRLGVEVTGYFFKRLAYRGQRSVEVAPLVVTAAPRRLSEAAQASAESFDNPLVMLGICGLIGAVAAALVVLRSRWSERRFEFPERIPLPALPAPGVPPSVSDHSANSPSGAS